MSGHGYEDRNVTFEVPEGVTIHFYVKSGRSLDVQEAIDMWNHTIRKSSKMDGAKYIPNFAFK